MDGTGTSDARRRQLEIVVDGADGGDKVRHQREAEAAGRESPRSLGAEFQLHGADGTIRQKDS